MEGCFQGGGMVSGGKDCMRGRDGFVPYMSNLFASGYNSKVEDVSIFCTVYRIYSQI